MWAGLRHRDEEELIVKEIFNACHTETDDGALCCFLTFLWCFMAQKLPPPPLEKCNSFLLCSFVVHKRLIISFDIQLSQVTYNEATSTQHQQQRRGGLKGRLGQRRGWDREGGVSLIVWHLLGVSTPVAPSSLPPSSTPPPLSALEKRQGSLKLLKSPLFNPRHPPTPLLNYIFHTRSLLLPPFVQSSSFCGLNFFE